MEMDKTFKPNVEWMAEKYDEMNHKLFGGMLGKCNFNIFTTGRGSEGRTLGWFKIKGSNIKIERQGRRLYRYYYFSGQKLYIDSSNFYENCVPTIELNGNYSGTEHGFLATLVHEMCHYYTYMNGYAPKQGHGVEFKHIGAIVSQRSKGLFTIQRLATAEDMSHLELSDEMKAKRAKRAANKMSKAIILVVYKVGGVRLIITTSEKLVYDIYNIETKRKDTIKIFRSNDANLLETLVSMGYRTFMRVYRYWSIGDKEDLLTAIENADGKEIYENDALLDKLPKTNKQTQTLSVNNHQEESPQPKRIFSIKTKNGETFECDGTAYFAIVKALQERFPNLSDVAIKRLVNNPANYRMEESKMNIKTIVEGVIDEFMQNEFKGTSNMDDSIDITPDMNLGKFSPFELK